MQLDAGEDAAIRTITWASVVDGRRYALLDFEGSPRGRSPTAPSVRR